MDEYEQFDAECENRREENHNFIIGFTRYLENKKLSKFTRDQEKELKNLAKSEKELHKQIAKFEADFKNVDKKYNKAKKYSRELEDKLIQKEDKIK